MEKGTARMKTDRMQRLTVPKMDNLTKSAILMRYPQSAFEKETMGLSLCLLSSEGRSC